MSTSPLVSVIVPTFNRARYLQETLESALAQTWSALEIIIVDDGSTDHTPDIVQQLMLRDSRIRYLRQENQGVSAARNRAIEMAQGQFLAFLDSDDVWFPWKLELQMKLFAARPELGMIWTNMDAISAEGQLLYSRYLHTMYSAYRRLPDQSLFQTLQPLHNFCDDIPPEFQNVPVGTGKIYSKMFQGNLVHTPTVVVKTDWARQVGAFDVTMRNGGEDYRYHLKTSRLGQVGFLDISSIKYRINIGDNITRKSNSLHFAHAYLKTISIELAESHGEHQLSKSQENQLLAGAHDWMAYELMEARQRLLSLKHATKSILLKKSPRRSWKTIVKCVIPLRRKDLARLKFWTRTKSTSPCPSPPAVTP